VDGTLLEAWASQKSVGPLDDDPDETVDRTNTSDSFHGQRCTNQTNRSVTDPEARLARMSSNTWTAMAHHTSAKVDNQHAWSRAVVGNPRGRADVRQAPCPLMGQNGVSPRATVGPNKAYDKALFIAGVRAAGYTPHVGEKVRGSAIDGHITRHAGYTARQRAHEIIDQVFGWIRTVVRLRKLKHRGTARINWVVTLAFARYTPARLRWLLAVDPTPGVVPHPARGREAASATRPTPQSDR
jgi:hypothetical protein